MTCADMGAPILRSRVGLVVVVVLVALATAGCFDWPQFRFDGGHSGTTSSERFLTAASAGALGVPASVVHAAVVALSEHTSMHRFGSRCDERRGPRN